MKTRKLTFIIAAIAVLFGLVACASRASQPTEVLPTATEEPTVTTVPTVNALSAVVFDMNERFNAGDLDGVMDYFADDSLVYFFGLPPTGSEVYKGKDQISLVWKDNIDNHVVWEIDIISVVDNVVTSRAKTWHDFTRQLGVAPIEAYVIYEIEDGEITSYSWTITEKSLAELKAALAETMPDQPDSATETLTPAENPVSEVTVTIPDGRSIWSQCRFVSSESRNPEE